MRKDTLNPESSHGNGHRAKAPLTGHKGKQAVNLRKRGFLRFQLGLIIALLLVYVGLEASFRINDKIIDDFEPQTEEATLLEADIPIIVIENDHPKPEKKKVRRTFTVAPDEPTEPVDPDIFIDPDPDEGNIDIDSIAYSDPTKDEPPTIIIDLVEEVPIFPGCEKVEKEERLACFKEKMTKHVKRNFRYPEAAKNMNIQGRVHVTFKVGTNGTVQDIQMRGPADILEVEAARIIGKLPKMVPGKQGGKAVKVPYSIPIYFKLN